MTTKIKDDLVMSNKSEKDKCKSCIVKNGTLHNCIKCSNVKKCCEEDKVENCRENKKSSPPFVVSHSDVLGRYLKASREIQSGELIHKETPTAIGPQPGSSATCLGCLSRIFTHSGFHHCSNCHVGPFCNSNCTIGKWHTDLECSALKSHCAKQENMQTLTLQSQTIMPLRCFLLQWTNPSQWKSLMELETHITERKGTSVWRSVDECVVYVLIAMGLISPEDQDTIQKICSILDVNSFEVRGPDGAPLRAIYPTAALLAHDCLPTTCVSHEPNTMVLNIRAAFRLECGSLITHNYAGTLICTMERRESLRKGKYFDCNCRRCSDPFELGTNMSSLKCCSCKEGPVISKNPLDQNEDWKCEQCGYEISGALAAATVSVARTMLAQVNQRDIEELEMLLDMLKKSFYPGHAILLEVGQILGGLYNEDATRWAMSFRQNFPFCRRWELCEELLETLKKLEPGISRMKGVCMYEMAIPGMMLATKGHETGDIQIEQTILILEDCEKLLQQSVANLLYEPSGSPEQSLIYSALKSLRKVRELIINYSKDNK